MLISKLRQAEKACKLNKNQKDWNLSNVRCFPSHIEISLKNGSNLELTGYVIKLGASEISLENIVRVDWITPDDNRKKKARMKQENFDCIYLQTDQEVLALEGMGQSVFPIMSFINWVIIHG